MRTEGREDGGETNGPVAIVVGRLADVGPIGGGDAVHDEVRKRVLKKAVFSRYLHQYAECLGTYSALRQPR